MDQVHTLYTLSRRSAVNIIQESQGVAEVRRHLLGRMIQELPTEKKRADGYKTARYLRQTVLLPRDIAGNARYSTGVGLEYEY
jgi:hypothetical protein